MHVLRMAGVLVLAGATAMGIASGVVVAGLPGHVAAAALAPVNVNLVIVPDSLKGNDKKTHDAYLPTTITAVAGQSVTVTVYNLDTAAHSVTSSALGLNVTIRPASAEGTAAETSFTFKAKKAGVYHWLCTLPCDNGGVHAWAMTHDGYMAGEIIVKSA